MDMENKVTSFEVLKVVLLKIHVCLYVLACCWIYSFTCFENEGAVIVSNVWLYTPMTQHHIPELLNIQKKSYRKSMHFVFKSLPRQMADLRSFALCKYQNPVYLHTRISSTR